MTTREEQSAASGSGSPISIPVAASIRLRRIDSDTADDSLLREILDWYQDLDTVWMVDGPNAEIYDLAKLRQMIEYMSGHGELYLVERWDAGRWRPIGDVGLQRHAVPIVLAPGERGRGIGRAVITALVQRARDLGWSSVEVSEIYHDNHPSRRLFESLGFVRVGATEHGHRYRLELS